MYFIHAPGCFVVIYKTFLLTILTHFFDMFDFVLSEYINKLSGKSMQLNLNCLHEPFSLYKNMLMEIV